MTDDSGSAPRGSRAESPPSQAESPSERRVSRRRVLAAAGAAGTFTLPSRTTRAAGPSATFHVRAYPGPQPFYVWLRQACVGITSGWSPVYRDAIEAVEETLERVASYVRRHSTLDEVDARVERRSPADFSLHSMPASVADVPLYSADRLFESFRDLVIRRDALEGSCCHLLLWWDPLNADVGYGGTRHPNNHVGEADGEGSQTVANLGATEWWDSRAVTRNMAIHETLHTFLSSDVAEDVNGSPCDHDLGRAVRTDDDVMRVSPMGTAYAGPEEIGGGTRWHGTGCFDHGSFSRHDGFEDVESWEYTPALSEATLEALTLYAERHLAE